MEQPKNKRAETCHAALTTLDTEAEILRAAIQFAIKAAEVARGTHGLTVDLGAVQSALGAVNRAAARLNINVQTMRGGTTATTYGSE